MNFCPFIKNPNSQSSLRKFFVWLSTWLHEHIWPAFMEEPAGLKSLIRSKLKGYVNQFLPKSLKDFLGWFIDLLWEASFPPITLLDYFLELFFMLGRLFSLVFYFLLFFIAILFRGFCFFFRCCLFLFFCFLFNLLFIFFKGFHTFFMDLYNYLYGGNFSRRLFLRWRVFFYFFFFDYFYFRFFVRWKLSFLKKFKLFQKVWHYFLTLTSHSLFIFLLGYFFLVLKGFLRIFLFFLVIFFKVLGFFFILLLICFFYVSLPFVFIFFFFFHLDFWFFYKFFFDKQTVIYVSGLFRKFCLRFWNQSKKYFFNFFRSFFFSVFSQGFWFFNFHRCLFLICLSFIFFDLFSRSFYFSPFIFVFLFFFPVSYFLFSFFYFFFYFFFFILKIYLKSYRKYKKGFLFKHTSYYTLSEFLFFDLFDSNYRFFNGLSYFLSFDFFLYFFLTWCFSFFFKLRLFSDFFFFSSYVLTYGKKSKDVFYYFGEFWEYFFKVRPLIKIQRLLEEPLKITFTLGDYFFFKRMKWYLIFWSSFNFFFFFFRFLWIFSPYWPLMVVRWYKIKKLNTLISFYSWRNKRYSRHRKFSFFNIVLFLGKNPAYRKKFLDYFLVKMYAFNVFCNNTIPGFFNSYLHELKFFFLKHFYYAFALSHVLTPRFFYFSRAVFGSPPKAAYFLDIFYDIFDIISTFFDSLFMFLFYFFFYLCFLFSIVLLFFIFISVFLFGLRAGFYWLTLFYTEKEVLYFFWIAKKYDLWTNYSYDLFLLRYFNYDSLILGYTEATHYKYTVNDIHNILFKASMGGFKEHLEAQASLGGVKEHLEAKEFFRPSFERDAKFIFFFKYIFPFVYFFKKIGLLKFYFSFSFTGLVFKPVALPFFFQLKYTFCIWTVFIYGIFLKYYSNFLFFLFFTYVLESLYSIWWLNVVSSLLTLYDDYLVYKFSEILMAYDDWEDWEDQVMLWEEQAEDFIEVGSEELSLLKTKFYATIDNNFFKRLIRLRKEEEDAEENFKRLINAQLLYEESRLGIWLNKYFYKNSKRRERVAWKEEEALKKLIKEEEEKWQNMVKWVKQLFINFFLKEWDSVRKHSEEEWEAARKIREKDLEKSLENASVKTKGFLKEKDSSNRK